MGNIITSAYDGDAITVDSILKDPTWIAEQVIKNLDNAFLVDAIFRDGGTNDGVVAYREAASPYLDRDAETVAEFGEIPVADLHLGAVKTVMAQKIALAVRISYEMKRFNKIDMLNKQVAALQNTVVRTSVNAGLAAFDRADVPVIAAGAPWTESTGSPDSDVYDAIDAIEGATVDGDPAQSLGFVPDTLVAHPRAVTALLRNEKVQRFYIGNAAAENPLYKGQHPNTLFGLNVLTSRYADPSRVIVLESQSVGFRSDAIPLQMTPTYAEGGGPESSGGPTMSWRADCFESRIYAVDSPKAAVIISGVAS